EIGRGAVAERHFHNALLKGFAGHRTGGGGTAAILAILPVEEEKCAILDDPAADRRAVLVTHQGSARHAGAVIEPVVGGEVGIAVEFVERSVKLVGTALGDQRNLAARGTPLIRAYTGNRRSKLLHGVERYRQDGVETGSALLIVHIHTIEHDVVLV